MNAKWVALQSKPQLCQCKFLPISLVTESRSGRKSTKLPLTSHFFFFFFFVSGITNVTATRRQNHPAREERKRCSIFTSPTVSINKSLSLKFVAMRHTSRAHCKLICNTCASPVSNALPLSPPLPSGQPRFPSLRRTPLLGR